MLTLHAPGSPLSHSILPVTEPTPLFWRKAKWLVQGGTAEAMGLEPQPASLTTNPDATSPCHLDSQLPF